MFVINKGIFFMCLFFGITSVNASFAQQLTNEELAKKMVQLERENHSLYNEVSSLRKELADQAKKIANLEDALKIEQNQSQKLLSETEMLKKENRTLQKNYKDLEDKLAEEKKIRYELGLREIANMNTIDSLRTLVSKLEGGNKKLQELLDNANKQKEELKIYANRVLIYYIKTPPRRFYLLNYSENASFTRQKNWIHTIPKIYIEQTYIYISNDNKLSNNVIHLKMRIYDDRRMLHDEIDFDVSYSGDMSSSNDSKSTFMFKGTKELEIGIDVKEFEPNMIYTIDIINANASEEEIISYAKIKFDGR